MRAGPTLKRLFLLALAPQVVVCVLYWLFGVDSSGGESASETALSYVYAPAKYIAAIAGILLMGGWAGIGFTSLAFPLLGAVLYSALFAAAVRAYQAGHVRAFFGLFRSGV